MFAGVERGGLQRISLAAAVALTIRNVRVAAMVWRWNGTRMVLMRIAKEAVLAIPQGFGCQIGAGLASIGASLFGATDFSLTPDGCSVTWDRSPDLFAPDEPQTRPTTPPETQTQPDPKPRNPKPRPPVAPDPKPGPFPPPHGPKPLPPGTGDSDGGCQLPPLYRATHKRDVPWGRTGMSSTVQGRETPIVEHILQNGPLLPDDSYASSWLSTTTDKAVAIGYAQGQGYGGYIVKINRCKLTSSRVVDVGNRDNGDPEANDDARRAREVLILYRINPEAISISQVN
jgi:hypothetical protein